MAKKKLLDMVREKIRLKHYSRKTEQAYTGWIKRYILFHDKKHPAEMGKEEIEAFLTWLAVERHVSPTTQNQAFNALLFYMNRFWVFHSKTKISRLCERKAKSAFQWCFPRRRWQRSFTR